MKIVLLGYMGCGKSTIGKILSKKMNLPFVDLDDYIVEKENLSIKSIFNDKGEIFFRKIENLYLKEFLTNNDNFILSLGGGTPCYANNMEVLKNENVLSIYLKANISTLVKRLIKNRFKRPLIANLALETIPDFIGKHLFERQFYYEQAKFKIITDNKSKKEIVKEIIDLLN